MSVSSPINYSIQNDTPNQQVDSDRLVNEIRASSISIALTDVSITGDVIAITFASDISDTEKTTLDTIIANHSGIPLITEDPTTPDGVLYVNPTVFPPGVVINFIGCADNITTGVRFGGDRFVVNVDSTDVPKNVVSEYQFIEPVYLSGGEAYVESASIDDWLNVELIAPATPATEVSYGSGSYVKAPVGGGINIFVPYAGGNWNLDLTAKLNANVNITQVVPVPAPKNASGNNTGYFNWDQSTGVVTVNSAGNGSYHLFDTTMILAAFLPKHPVLTGHLISFDANLIVTKLILPHWKVRIIAHKHSSNPTNLKLAFRMYIARKTITPNGAYL